MTGFVAQMLFAALLFGVIEGLDSLIRRVLPGRGSLSYALAKIGYGLPLVLIACSSLSAQGVPIRWTAIAAGLALAAAIALAFFGERRAKPQAPGG